jgi:putative acetyltransferase
MLTLRAETPEDHVHVRHIHSSAFRGDAEAQLVEDLLASEAFVPELSLVACQLGLRVGHVLFTRVSMPSIERRLLALAPLAVLPHVQRQRIGSALVERGLETAVALGYEAVVVLGHREYYPRFGFEPAERRGLHSRFKVSDGAFMVKELAPGALAGVQGEVQYSRAFDAF